jgi:hypothetical protein
LDWRTANVVAIVRFFTQFLQFLDVPRGWKWYHMGVVEEAPATVADVPVGEGEEDMSGCSNNVAYLAEETVRLRRAIARHRRELSRRSGGDVGYNKAKLSFVASHKVDPFAEGFRSDFCGHVCSRRGDCKLPSARKN